MVPFLQDYYFVLYMAVGEMYLEVGAFNRPLLTYFHGAVNFSRLQWG